MPTEITRRDLLTAGSAFIMAWGGRKLWQRLRPKTPVIDSDLHGASLGHRLRSRDFPAPSEFLKKDIVIVGGGVSGLSAAYHLKKHGNKNFMLLELESRAGGNSVWGENSVSRFPWGAHYLPLPSPKNKPLLEFLRGADVITGQDARGLPIYNELYACHDPQERILNGGKWSSGLLPLEKMDSVDHAEFERFSDLMDNFHKQVGRDDKPAFTIPLEDSSSDPKWTSYDQISMQEFMQQHDFNSRPLNWYVDYCMRDDFGTNLNDVSAWAGIHYYAARGGQASNLDSHAVLTWPEGNGWLAECLSKSVVENIRSNQIVFNLENQTEEVLVDAFDRQAEITRQISAKRVIYSAPRYTAFYTLNGYSEKQPRLKNEFQYSTWFIANVTLHQALLERPATDFRGAALSWDNIRFESEMLGYVVATHQNVKRFNNETVITLYWPLTGLNGTEARRWAERRTPSEWREDVLRELEAMHPGVSTAIQSIETKIWGHAMIQPRVGFIHGEARRLAHEDYGHVTFAHTDMSGISIFEHGFESGRRAALSIMGQLT
jgi:protoporphyrinogen oxidase